MTDTDLRADLARIDGDAPSPEFLASLFVAIAAERDLRHDEVERYRGGTERVVEIPVRARRTDERHPRSGRRWLGAVAAVAAACLVLGLMVADGDDGNGRVSTRLAHGFTPSALPDAIVGAGDGDVVLPDEPSPDLDVVLPPWYGETRSALEDLGAVAVLSAPFDLEIPGDTPDCEDLVRRIRSQSGLRVLPCGGSSAAVVFEDDVGAVRALDLLAGHLEQASAVYGLAVVLERVRDIEVHLGDEAHGFVLQQYIDDVAAASVVVVAWRTDNLVQLLWDIQDRSTPGGVDALLGVARQIERRTSTQQQPAG